MPSMPGVLSSSSGVGHAVETDHSRRIRMSGNENMTFGPKGYDKRVHGSAARTDRGYAAARPFLKWAGGKQQLLADYEQYFPTGFHRYFEPFLGGGAVFFHLRKTGRLPGAAYLFDNNEELINAYIMVRDNPDELIKILAVHKERHCREYYYKIRNLDRRTSGLNALSAPERAARTIYLNRTCYNGLYRVNKKGHFNVPAGRYKSPKILDAELLKADSCALQGVHLEVKDFRSVAKLAVPGDFFYFDPPYHPLSKTSSFTGYTAGSFSEEDQRDLAAVFTRLTAKGCLCMLSNSHTPFIFELYKGFRVETVRANRAINANSNGRGAVTEAVVLNY